jgi:TetR/AcrR family transcriptional repressor of nem operon
LYDTFGDKNQLFLNCLDRFQAVTKNRAFRILEEDGEPKELLQRYFDSLIDTALNNETGRLGCFIANTAMELGAVKAGRDIRETARFLVATRHGFYVLAKTATDRKVMEDTAKVVISAVFG